MTIAAASPACCCTAETTRCSTSPVISASHLVVDARDLLVALGDDADLGGRRPAASPTSAGAMPASRHALRQRRGRIVMARDGDERGASAERRDVVRHVGGAADPMAFVIEHDDRHRRFRRDAGHASRDELVEHGVADDEHVGARQAAGDRPRPVRRERRQHRQGAPPQTAA